MQPGVLRALEFDRVVTILIGEDGVGKSTILEGIAAVAGYDDAGKTSRAVALARAGETAIVDRLARALRSRLDN